MKARTRHAIAGAALTGMALVAAGLLPTVAGGSPTAHAVTRLPQVLVRRVTTLDAHGGGSAGHRGPRREALSPRLCRPGP